MGTVQVDTFSSVLDALRVTPSPSAGVLSVYLDTRSRPSAREAYVMAYRDGCKAHRAALPRTSLSAFEAAAARAEEFLLREVTPGVPGIAIFSAPAGDYFFHTRLPEAPARVEVVWQARPYMIPLEVMSAQFARFVVALVDQARTRLLVVSLGACEESVEFEDDVPGKQSTGGWYSLAQTGMARHREDHVMRHMKRSVESLLDVSRRRPFERLFLAGPDEALTLMQRQLTPALRAKLAGTLRLELFAGEQEILDVAQDAAAARRREDEKRLVMDLLNADAGVVFDLDDTLAALNDGSVGQLVLACDTAEQIGQCVDCRRLSPTAGTCPFCGKEAPATSLSEAAYFRAMSQRARVDFVRAGAAEQLERFHGIGAWLRFAPA